MDEVNLLIDFFKAIFGAMKTPLTVPFVGTFTPLGLLVLSATISWIAWLSGQMMFGGRNLK